MRTITNEPPLADTSGGAQDRQRQCNISNKAWLVLIKSAFINNLRDITCDGHRISFRYRELKAKKGSISLQFNLPNESLADISIIGYKTLVEITATATDVPLNQSSICVKTLLVAHTTVHERYLKECASIFQAVLDIHRLQRQQGPCPIAPHGLFDFATLRQNVSPYIRFMLCIHGDNKDLRLYRSWKETGTLAGAELSSVIYDFWYENVQKAEITQLMHSMAKQLTARL